MMKTKTYLSELPREEIKKMISYPSELCNELYEQVAESNGWFASDVMSELLGKDYNKWTKYDSCSYDWWMNIRSGEYKNILDVPTDSYFSEDSAAFIDKKKEQVAELVKKIDNLDGDDDDYWDKLYELEDEADKLADEALQEVVKLVKSYEEVTDDQILDEFECNDWGSIYYYLGDDKSRVFKDVVKSYNTYYKEGE